MKLKILTVFSLVIFVCQIIYSIYFSIKIVDQNSLINQFLPRLNQASIKHQLLKNQFALLNSLETINQNAISKSLIPINSSIDLSQ